MRTFKLLILKNSNLRKPLNPTISLQVSLRNPKEIVRHPKIFWAYSINNAKLDAVSHYRIFEAKLIFCYKIYKYKITTLRQIKIRFRN